MIEDTVRLKFVLILNLHVNDNASFQIYQSFSLLLSMVMPTKLSRLCGFGFTLVRDGA